MLLKHKSRLEQEKEKALQAKQAGKSDTAVTPGYMKATAASRHAAAHGSSLAESLLLHKSRLEREREAAIEAAKPRTKARVIVQALPCLEHYEAALRVF